MLHNFHRLNRPQKLLMLILSFILVAAGIYMLSGCGGPKEVGYKSYKDPNYQRKDYKQLLVFARIEQDSVRHKVEESISGFLAGKGFNTIPAYKHLDVSYKYDSVKFMSKINELKVDGIVVVDYLGQTTVVTDEYRYTGGPYTMFSSNYIPYDLDTRSEKVGYARVDFYNLDSRASQWNTVVQVKPSNGLEAVIRDFSNEFFSRARLDGIL